MADTAGIFDRLKAVLNKASSEGTTTATAANRMAEERSGAVLVAQQVMEGIRQRPPDTLPSTGSAPTEIHPVCERQFEVDQHFCQTGTHCNADSRHVIVEVRYGGRVIYELETVFVALR